MSKPKFNIILLKSSDQTTANKDRYIEYLSEKNNSDQVEIKCIKQINLLKFEYVNQEVIHKRLQEFVLNNSGKLNDFKSLIITSGQTIESIELAFKSEIDSKLDAQKLPELEDDLSLQDVSEESFKTKFLIYCVGQATFSRLKKLLRKLKLLNESTDLRVLVRNLSSESKQNAIELSRLIVQDYAQYFANQANTWSTFAFYPCSSIRRDELYTELKKASVSFEELTAYKTAHSEQGLFELQTDLSEFVATSDDLNILAFFSPSGVEGVFENEKLSRLIKENSHRIRLISIGPSTSAKLKHFISEQAIYELDEPSPQALYKQLNLF